MNEHRFSDIATGIVGLALLVIPPLCWATGAPNPLAAPGDSSGRSLALLPQPMAHLVMAVCGVVVVAAAAWQNRAVRITALGAFALLLDAGALAAIGYLPFMVVSAVTGHVDNLSAYLSIPLLMQLGMAVAAASLLWTVVDRPVSGTHERARIRTARWTRIAMIAPLFYAATRVLMALDVPGFAMPSMDVSGKAAGLGLALAAVGGTALTWGLIRPWGERWPRWIPFA
ncbi:hypothetical protein ABTZ89_23055, partial [Saccharopolyspora sp. NPDC002686]